MVALSVPHGTARRTKLHGVVQTFRQDRAIQTADSISQPAGKLNRREPDLSY